MLSQCLPKFCWCKVSVMWSPPAVHQVKNLAWNFSRILIPAVAYSGLDGRNLFSLGFHSEGGVGYTAFS